MQNHTYLNFKLGTKKTYEAKTKPTISVQTSNEPKLKMIL